MDSVEPNQVKSCFPGLLGSQNVELNIVREMKLHFLFDFETCHVNHVQMSFFH